MSNRNTINKTKIFRLLDKLYYESIILNIKEKIFKNHCNLCSRFSVVRLANNRCVHPTQALLMLTQFSL